jgi:hypothetical protein
LRERRLEGAVAQHEVVPLCLDLLARQPALRVRRQQAPPVRAQEAAILLDLDKIIRVHRDAHVTQIAN